MRAVTHQQFGEPTDVLELTEIPDPAPAAGEVLVRMVLSPIHNHDLWTVRGSYGVKPELPARAGTEALGVVEQLGEGVTQPAVGQRVVATSQLGVWAELFTAPADSLIPVPDGLDDETAAQLAAMPFSALSLLQQLDLAPGETLVQNAANGAVGRLISQFARARGVNVVGLVRRSSGVDELAEQGITGVVATDTEGWEERARALIGDAPARAGIDSVGGEAAGQVMSLLADGGKLVVFGAMAAPVMEIPSGPVIFRDLHIEGFWGATVSKEMPTEERSELFREIIGRLLEGSVTLPVEATYPIAEARQAAAANLEAGRTGKVLLRP
ncbi:NADPH:quinone oxidoreductase [Brachybacterium endophyticum]|uniref:enoyl-[acyl-carrier-protein] reductase n=1 Tax=Brachybacterium endophyticum TaxID=2182385 RepID=A0A2U2RKP1_9MICO|nr:zinc-binding dehydrogenase [Brachybacterium endophyticum]PWH06401.1 NADPH:quinone oxidoreductase [Brachybacterium endophyticum]